MALAIFDLDNTLVDRVATFRRWAGSFVARHDLEPREVAWLEARDGDGDGFTPRKQFLSAVRERYGIRESVSTLLRRFRGEIVALVEPDPPVSVVLDALREAGWRIAIATNGGTAQQWAKIHNAALDGHVDQYQPE